MFTVHIARNMRTSRILPILAVLATAVYSNSLFASLPNADKGVSIGETHDIVWMSDALEKLEVCLIRKGDEDRGDPPDVAWSYVDCLFIGNGQTPGGRLAWQVHDYYEPGDGYAFRLEADPRGFGKWLRKSSVDMTDWFEIASPGEKMIAYGTTSHVQQEKSGLRLDLPQSELQRVLLEMQPGFRCDEACVGLA